MELGIQKQKELVELVEYKSSQLHHNFYVQNHISNMLLVLSKLI